MRRSISLLIAALVGCANEPHGGEPGIGPADNPVVYIVRAPGFYGVGVKPVIFLNGAEIGTLGGGAYIACSVPPGTVRIGTSISTGAPVDGHAFPTSSKDITRLSFTAELGKEYFVRWQSGPQVVLVPPGEEQNSMRLTRRQQGAC
jgi:hypothetical protein